MIANGALLFARYAYPPNALGYCGPDDHGGLLDYGTSEIVDRGLVELARDFEGAWPYLELIAGANGIADPLDARVVDAYWIGNRLLERVDVGSLGTHVEDRFRRVAGRAWDALAEAVPAGAVPHHDFHVFCVYPWAGLMRAGPAEPALDVLDRCRIRSGRVLSVAGEEARVAYRPLAWDGRHLSLGAPTVEQLVHARNGKSFVHDLRAGDLVSMHWGWICERLSARRAEGLRRITIRHLALVNRSADRVGRGLTVS